MRYVLLVLAHVVLRVLGWFLLALVLWRLPDSAKRLPQWFVWWDNYTDGIDGDPNFQKETAAWSVFRRRWVWLAWRNPVHNWSRYVGCVQATAVVLHAGTLPDDYRGIEGRMLSVAMDEAGNTFWQDYSCWKWPLVPYCVRRRYGWKLRKVTEQDPLPAGYIAALVFYFHPFKKFGPRS